MNNNNDNSNNSNQTIHAEISIFPIGTNSTSISKEVTAAFDAIRKTKDIKVATLTPMGTQVEVNDMRVILNCIQAAHEAVKSTGAKRIVSTIRIAQRFDVSRTLEDEVKSVTEKLPD